MSWSEGVEELRAEAQTASSLLVGKKGPGGTGVDEEEKGREGERGREGKEG